MKKWVKILLVLLCVSLVFSSGVLVGWKAHEEKTRWDWGGIWETSPPDSNSNDWDDEYEGPDPANPPP